MKSLIRKLVPQTVVENYREAQRRKKAIDHFFQVERQNPGNFYSLNAFDYYKCIFVHVPKAAGVSVNKSLFGTLGGGHYSLKEYQRIFYPATFQRYFKFTFVRNPYDRLYSAFTFLKKGGFDKRDAAWAEEHLLLYPTFEKFVKEWVSESNIYSKNHFTPQFNYLILHDGNMGMDFVGKVENMGDDYKYVCRKLKINHSLEHFNSTGKKINNNLWDGEMKSIVERVYAKDFELLGY